AMTEELEAVENNGVR
nr:RecName: Full=Secreted protein F1 [Globisporangium hypogynum]